MYCMKKYLFIIVFFILTYVYNFQVSAMQKSISSINKLIITRLVVGEVIATLPMNIEKICVFEVLNDDTFNVLDLENLDNRIVTDCYAFNSLELSCRSCVTILFVQDVSFKILQMERPNGKFGEVYDKVLNYIDAGNIVASAGVAKCSADMNVYVFSIDESGPRLIDSLVISKVECLAK